MSQDESARRKSVKRTGKRYTVDMRTELDSLIADCYGEDEDIQSAEPTPGTPPSPSHQSPIDIYDSADTANTTATTTDTDIATTTIPDYNTTYTATGAPTSPPTPSSPSSKRALAYSRSQSKIVIPKLNVDGNGRSSIVDPNYGNGIQEKLREKVEKQAGDDTFNEQEIVSEIPKKLQIEVNADRPSTPEKKLTPTSPSFATLGNDKGRKSLFFDNAATKAVKASILTTNTANGPDGPYTVYVLEVSSEGGQVIQNVSKRFKNFSELVEKLKDRAPELTSMLPARVLLGNMAARLVSHRKIQLQALLDYILGHKELSRSVEVHAFFRNPTLLTQLASKPDMQGCLHKGFVGALGVKYIQMWALLKSPCLYFCQSQLETAELKSAVVLRWLTVDIVDEVTFTIELRPWQYFLFPSDPQSRPITIRTTSREEMFHWTRALHYAKAAVNDILMLKKTMLHEEDPTAEIDLGDDEEVALTPRQLSNSDSQPKLSPLSLSPDSKTSSSPLNQSGEIDELPSPRFISSSVPSSPRILGPDIPHRNRYQTQPAPLPPKIVSRSQTESQLNVSRKQELTVPSPPVVRYSTPVSKLKDFVEKTDTPPLSRFEARMALMKEPPKFIYPPPSPGKMLARKSEHNPLLLSSHIPTPDTEENILLSSTKQQYIRGATANKLFEKVIDHTFTGTEYLDLVSAFLIGYRTFASPTELLDRLIQAGTEKLDSNTTRLSICNFMSKWIDFHLHDFLADTSLVNKLITFLDSILQAQVASSERSAVEKVKSTIKKRTRDVVPNRGDENQPQSILPPLFLPLCLGNSSSVPFLVMDFDKTEIARHLCVLEFDAFSKILPTECLNQAWNKKNKETQAANITAIIKRFNEVSCWVSSMVVTTEELKARTAVLARFIEIAEECRQFNNFNAVVAIVSGLESSAVHRLKKTWAGLPLPVMETFELLKNLMSTEKNYLTYRNVVKLATPPCIPYLGVFLTDLVFIDEAPDVLQPSGLINFDKWYKVALVVREIRKFQVTRYPFRRVTEVTNTLANLPFLPENEIYSLSLKCEERAK